MAMHGMTLLDWIIILLYFAAVYLVAFYASPKRQNPVTDSANYFLAGRNTGWFVIGASLFAANIGSEHLVGLAGTASSKGVVIAHFELFASLVLLLLAWFFVPFYLKSAVYTMPEFLERRYSPATRWYLAIISIIGYILTKISVTIVAGAMVIEAVTGMDFWMAALIVVVLTGLYTVWGGLRAVMYTNALQMLIFTTGAILMTVVGLHKLGGWEQMRQIAGPEFFNLWRPVTDPTFPWTGVIFGAPILGVWYWCTDQFIVQKTLAAANIDQARGGSIFTGYLKLLPLFIFILPGIIIYCLAKKGDISLTNPDQAFTVFVQALLPSGLRGLVIAGLLAALMSSLSSVFNACSSLITLDVYKKLRPQASDHHLAIVGQIATGVVILLGILWVPFIKLISGQLYEYLQMVQAYIAPPIAAVFLIGLLWSRVNAKGALVTLLVGLLIGVCRLVGEIYRNNFSQQTWVHSFLSINFLHFAILLFVFCGVLLILVSLLTSPPDREKIMGLSMTSRIEELNPYTRLRSVHVALSIFLVIGVVAIWFYFSGI